jgi:outer membrane protein
MMMKSLLLASIASVALLASGASADTLPEALATAYSSNPDIAAQRAALRALDEDVSEAVSGYRPNVTGSADLEYRDINSTGRNGDYGSLDRSAGVQVNQPIYRGGRTQNSVRAAEAGVKAGRQQLRGVEIRTLLDVVSAYMDVVRDTAEVELNNNQVEVLRRQLQATRDRFKVGELTRTDVAQSESRLSRSITGRTQAEGQLTASREAYRRVVGSSPGALKPPPKLVTIPANVEEAIEIGLRNSPTLLAARAIEEAARFGVDVAKGAVLPSVSAVGGYTYSGADSPNGTGGTRNIDTRVGAIGARLTIPIFQSGAEYAAVRRAQQVRSQRTLEIAAAERQVVESIRNAWAQYQTSVSSIESTTSAVNASTIALEGVKQEQQVGSRTILDVLDAEQELLDSRVQLVRAQRNEYVASFALLAATGQIGARELDLQVDVYNPETHFNQVRNKIWGWQPDR